jgi:hypothetical protein
MGAVFGLLLLLGLQMINNMVFDPIFRSKVPRPVQNSGEHLHP